MLEQQGNHDAGVLDLKFELGAGFEPCRVEDFAWPVRLIGIIADGQVDVVTFGRGDFPVFGQAACRQIMARIGGLL
ncbi:hypothetical protein EDD52_12818 [Primorskyibacter sedentarius]|uniref:Uncharacterized protein n=1 Tax=Primorskyibacter sedentarius TaxID=745311 RepID=A0A4R3IYW3_9RHOB|nr:hypothetical protein EDD52_12818 [Primorskyibacter sedentarius]